MSELISHTLIEYKYFWNLVLYSLIQVTINTETKNPYNKTEKHIVLDNYF